MSTPSYGSPGAMGRTDSESGAGTADGATDKAKQAASQAASQAKETASQVATQGQQVAQHASSNAKEVAGTAAQSAQQVAGEARQQAMQLTQEATHHVRSLAGETQTQLREHASTQAERAAGTMRSFSDQARALAEGRPDEAGQVGQYVQQAGDKLAEIAGRIENGGLDGVMEDVRTFARRRPGAFLVGAGIVGFVGGRILRGAQAVQNEQQSQQAGGYGMQTPMPAGNVYSELPEAEVDLRTPTRSGVYAGQVGGY